jgi:uncharacterized protein YifN (PemK superfamily)
MAIAFTPKRGQILICDFDMAGVLPEMRKVRRVVVVSHRSSNRAGRLVAVPFSATRPQRHSPSHVHFQAGSYASFRVPVWAICDCIAHVSFRRLDRVFCHGRFLAETMTDADLRRIATGIRHALAL